MAEVASGLLTEAAKAALKPVLTHLSEQVNHACNFKQELKTLDSKLKTISLLLQGADHQYKGITINNSLVHNWLSKVKNIAYDVDDLLDELAYKALKHRLETKSIVKSATWLRSLSLANNPIVFRVQMGRRAKELVDMIDGLFVEARELGIRAIDIATGSSDISGGRAEEKELQVQRELVTGRGLIGRDVDERNIVKLLCDQSNLSRDLSVVAIVGLAGLGKTALCRRAFNKSEVKEYFQERIWVCVSHDFEVRGILMKIIELVGGKMSNTSSLQAMLVELEKKLRQKRYLLVLDDIWDTFSNVWESMCGIMLETGGSKGSVILATSRSFQVAATLEIHVADQLRPTTNRPLIYELRGLGYDDSWLLVQQRVQLSKDVGSELKTSVGRMLIKCGGVPLAIKALGDLLRSRRLEEWREIEESEIWKSEDRNGILPSLKLSFNYLPSPALKNCFAYCAVFPEDADIRKETLIGLWMAQGFLQPYDKMEQVGNEYFNILLNNSFFQDVEFDLQGNVLKFKMHDVVHALAKAVSERECLILRECADVGNNVSPDIRHLCLETERNVNRKLKKQLRTMMCVSVTIQKPRGILSATKFLRALVLVDIGMKELPDSIGSLKHLRYLDISENDIMMLPTAVTRLYNLQTLRHLSKRIWRWPVYPAFPKGLSKLVNLRYIVANRFLLEKPQSTVKTFDQVVNWGGKISDLNAMNNLRGGLAIWNLEHVSSREEARKANLRFKKNVSQLDLTWSYNTSCERNSDDVLEELQPHVNIKKLSIWYFNGRKSPSWLTEMSSLVQIKILYCRNLEELPASLVFPSLKILSVWGCDSLISFPDPNGFVALEQLQIGRCCMLENLPNLKSLRNLMVLEIHDCRKLTTLPEGVPWLSNLTSMKVGPLCQDLHLFPFSADLTKFSPLCTSLRKLNIRGWPKVKSLPDQIQYFTRLERLSIGYFDCVEVMPEWLGNLQCLEVMELWHMFGLKYLPSQDAVRRAKRLHQLIIGNSNLDCPGLLLQDKEEFAKQCYANLLRLQDEHLPSYKLSLSSRNSF